MIEKKQPLVILTGPTAAGKTALSLQLAEPSAEKLSPPIPCRYTGIWILVPPRYGRKR